MVWRETGIMDERLRFVVECLSGDETMVALCAALRDLTQERLQMARTLSDVWA
ncbi:hypothetical protein X726_24300 [Mesorhizobium sp. L103C105A0]|nr:hypothetical protein X726_24300 [Mesorhizobium sp. L103C105A0]